MTLDSRLVALALVLLSACTTTTVPVQEPAPQAPATVATVAGSPCVPGDSLLNASLWVQSAAEYDASATQVYNAARRMLDLALGDRSWSAMNQTDAANLPLAVILDLDETALDNVVFEARAIHEGKTFSEELWQEWVRESAAKAVPGALEFLRYAQSRGVTPFYITNRDIPEEPTRRNLERLGFYLHPSEDNLLLRGEKPEWKVSDKTGRREFVAARYRVLLLLGDDLNDFVFATGKSAAERDAMVAANAAMWGSKWFILPNPMYGSWERAALTNATGANDCEKKKSVMIR